MPSKVEKTLERFEDIKLKHLEKRVGGFSLTFGVTGPILHEISFGEGEMVGHFIKTDHVLNWPPKLDDLELLMYYFKFLRALCDTPHYPPKENIQSTLDPVKPGKVSVVEVCKIYLGNNGEKS